MIFDTWGGLLAHAALPSRSRSRRCARCCARSRASRRTRACRRSCSPRAAAQWLDDIAACGATRVGLDWTVDLAAARARVRRRASRCRAISIRSCCSPTPATVAREAERGRRAPPARRPATSSISATASCRRRRPSTSRCSSRPSTASRAAATERVRRHARLDNALPRQLASRALDKRANRASRQLCTRARRASCERPSRARAKHRKSLNRKRENCVRRGRGPRTCLARRHRVGRSARRAYAHSYPQPVWTLCRSPLE